ncbi:uncharacterized protein C21orf58 homolog [Stegastes partitus]|uniref:Uncharacterized protein C21orf58 homolog n=1 Tax=Stegastes partitus TaxID=144197 RepID=A0A9Y4JQL8_9TELE|nr:PREDICTED: uncharacterized protein C21orf58-like [Stegastes partitus]
MSRLQDGSSVADQLTRLRLKLLEKRLESKKNNMDDRVESAQSARSYDGQMDALHRALRRKQDLLQRLREQYMLEDLNRLHTRGGSLTQQYQSRFITPPQLPPPPAPMAPTHIYRPANSPSFLSPSLPAMPQPPHIIQQTLTQHPATIIQQLPQHQPRITPFPPRQPYPEPRSGSIKEDMVELMLMQNAQMHQIIMHNMMLRAMPPMALSPPGGSHHCAPHSTYLEQAYSKFMDVIRASFNGIGDISLNLSRWFHYLGIGKNCGAPLFHMFVFICQIRRSVLDKGLDKDEDVCLVIYRG